MPQSRCDVTGHFNGLRGRFDVPLAPAGTDFQRSVWAALGFIESGRTVTYTELALMLGREDAVRAVAQAVARNAIMILVPCHRVLGADGRLAGYSAGLNCKQRLLKIEGAAPSPAHHPGPKAPIDCCIWPPGLRPAHEASRSR